MKVTVKGKTINLRGLTDSQYERAEGLAKTNGGKGPLDECSTCDGKMKSISDSGVKEFVSNTYTNIKGEKVKCDCQTQMALRSRYLLANIGDQYMRLDWDTFDNDETKDTVDEYVENWESFLHHGYGLELGGDLGVGKTFAATHIAKEMVKSNQSVYFTMFKDMAFAYEKNDSALEDRFRESTFLVIDEVLAPYSDKVGSIFADKFEATIRHRTNCNLPTIITTNVAGKKLEGMYERVYSLLSAKQVRIEVVGKDYRGDMGRENISMALNKERKPIT